MAYDDNEMGDDDDHDDADNADDNCDHDGGDDDTNDDDDVDCPNDDDVLMTTMLMPADGRIAHSGDRRRRQLMAGCCQLQLICRRS